MAASSGRVASSVMFKQLATKFQGGRIAKIGNYFKNILNDYKTVAVDTVEDIKKNKVKAVVYFSGIGLAGFLMKTNPSEQQFYEQLVENTNELMTLGDPIRNVESDNHMQALTMQWNQGLLRRFTFGVCSVMWVDDFDPCVDIYEKHCNYLKVRRGSITWFNRIVDIGILGRWQKLDRAMTDYDINPIEWKDVKTSEQ